MRVRANHLDRVTSDTIRAMRGRQSLRLLRNLADISLASHWLELRGFHTTLKWKGSLAVDPGLQFYRNRQLELFAGKEAKRLSLRQLV